jgi:hypothetical protein
MPLPCRNALMETVTYGNRAGAHAADWALSNTTVEVPESTPLKFPLFGQESIRRLILSRGCRSRRAGMSSVPTESSSAKSSRSQATSTTTIFDGLAVKSKQSAHVRYVPGEKVAAIFPGEVTLKIAAAETDTLEPFSEPAPQTKILPQEAPLGNRISSWLRGKR